jgi:hypothetical protein
MNLTLFKQTHCEDCLFKIAIRHEFPALNFELPRMVTPLSYDMARKCPPRDWSSTVPLFENSNDEPVNLQDGRIPF